MKIPKKLPYTVRIAAVLLGCLLPLAGFAGVASATGDAYFILSPSSGSYTVGNTLVVTVSEYSSGADDVDAVQANLSYNTSVLTYESMTLGAFNSLCPQQTAGGGSVSIGCATTGGAVSGTQTVAELTFNVSGSGSPSNAIAMTSGSNIDNTGGSSVWNGVLPSGSYTFSAASSGSSGSSGSSSSGSSSGSSSSSKKSTSGSSTPATTTTPSTSSTSSTAKTTTPTTTPGASSNAATTQNTTQVTQTGSLIITVTNSQGQPIKGAEVSLDNGSFAYTNATGKADFTNIATGSHSVTVSANGKKKTQTINLNSSQDKLVSVKLATGSSSAMLIIIIGAIAILAGAGGAALWYFKLRKPPTATGDYDVTTPIKTPPAEPPAQPMAPTTQPKVIIGEGSNYTSTGEPTNPSSTNSVLSRISTNRH